jgi:hypothetical protein
MDLNALVRLIYAKHELMLGVSITLLLIVTVLMLVRSVMEDRQAEKTSGKTGDLDAKTLNTALEGAMKKVLADKGIQGAIAGAAASGSSEVGASASALAPETQELKKSLSEKEAKIAALMSDIETLKIAAEKVQPTADGGVVPGVDVSALQAKLVELQAKLAEYEIIEDDIADLSMYKEENKKLKAELATLKAAVETAQTQVHAASVSVEAAPRAEDPVQAAQAAVKASPPPQEKFELDKNDSVMNEFAQAISGAPEPELPDTSFESQLVVSSDSPLADPQAAIDAIMTQAQAEALVETLAEPLAEPLVETPASTEEAVAEDAASDTSGIANGDVAEAAADFAQVDLAPSVLDEALDTNKLQAEVSKLAAELESMALQADGEQSVLDEALDTEKLIQELAGGEEPVKPIESLESSLLNPRDSVVDSAKPQIVESGAQARPAAVAEDDLLAEFKDMDFQNSKTTKGS